MEDNAFEMPQMRGGKGKVVRWAKGDGQVGNKGVGRWEIGQYYIKRVGRWTKGGGQWAKGRVDG